MEADAQRQAEEGGHFLSQTRFDLDRNQTNPLAHTHFTGLMSLCLCVCEGQGGGGLPQHSHDVSNPLHSKFFFFPFHLFFFKKLSHDSYSPLPFSGEGQRVCVCVRASE